MVKRLNTETTRTSLLGSQEQMEQAQSPSGLFLFPPVKFWWGKSEPLSCMRKEIFKICILNSCRRSCGSEGLGEKLEDQRSHQLHNLRSHLVQLPQGAWGREKEGLWECLEEDVPLSSKCLDSILSTIWWWPWGHCLSTGSTVREKSCTLGEWTANTADESEDNLEPAVLSADTTCKHGGLHGIMASAWSLPSKQCTDYFLGQF